MAISPRFPKVPKFLLHIFFTLNIFKRFISFVFRFLGLSTFSDSTEENGIIPQPPNQSHSVAAAADLIKKILPVVKFEELTTNGQDSCAICLCEFNGEDEVRPLIDCSHIFHGSCLDGWMDQDQRTCPLCRTPFVPIETRNALKESLHLSS